VAGDVLLGADADPEELAVRGAPVHALAVPSHRGEDEELAQAAGAVLEALEQGGGAADVDVDIVLDLVQRLADADGGRGVHDRVDAVEGSADRALVTHVRHDQLRTRCEIGRRSAGMHLGVEAVQHPHGVTLGEQSIDDEGADESRTPGDQNDHVAGGCSVLPPPRATRRSCWGICLAIGTRLG
jgi:hypothetical protein